MQIGNLEIDYYPHPRENDFLPKINYFEKTNYFPLGDSSLCFSIGGNILKIDNIPENIKNSLIKCHGPLTSEDENNANYQIGLFIIEKEEFLKYPTENYELKRFLLGEDDKYIYFWTYHLAGYLNKDKFSGKAFLCIGNEKKAYYILNDLILGYCSWWSIHKGGFVIHGASIIKDEKAYIFFGPPSIGKTTICLLSEQREIISDEYSLVIPKNDNYFVYRPPQKKSFTKLKDWKEGFQLEGLFKLKQDNSTFLEEVPSSIMTSELLANLLFAHAYNVLGNQALINAVSLIKRFKKGILHFQKNLNFWEVI